MDFGCGQQPYRSIFKVDEYIGVDTKKSGHRNFYKRANVYYDGITIPFDDNYFDAALATQCFEHIYDVNHIVSEINRVLKPNGTLIITLPLCWEEHEIPYDFFRFTSYGIKAILIKNNFKIVSIKKLNSYKNAIRQVKINYYAYKQNKNQNLENWIKLKFITIWNNFMFKTLKDEASDEPFSTCIGVICKKI